MEKPTMNPIVLATSAPIAPGPDWWGALNGLHPLVIHFPIALVITAAAVEFIAMLARKERPTQFTVIALVVGAIMSGIASWSGWGLADEGYGGGWALDLHRWLGIATSGVLIILAICAVIACSGSKPDGDGARSNKAWATATVRAGILVAAALVAATAHFGGEMVWGKSMVIESLFPEVPVASTVAPDEEPAAPDTDTDTDAPAPDAPAAVEPATEGRKVVDFRTDVLPVISEHCWKCHGPAELGKRAKAGLRMGTRSDFFDDRAGEVMVKPGDPEGSMLYHVITLPRSDDMAMPPNAALDAASIEAVRVWIEEGAPFPDGSLVELSAGTATPKNPAPATPAGDGGAAKAAPVVTADQATMARLRERGVPARPIAQDGDALEFNANALSHRIDPPFSDADVLLLDGLQPLLVDVDLSNTQVTDAGVAHLTGFDRLRSVKLKDTRTGSEAARVLAALPALEVVNFYGSDLDDAGLAVLSKAPSIRTIYAGETKVTDAGVEAARAANPELVIHHQRPSAQIAAPEAASE
jgi:uncharacterized membrane protein